MELLFFKNFLIKSKGAKYRRDKRSQHREKSEDEIVIRNEKRKSKLLNL